MNKDDLPKLPSLDELIKRAERDQEEKSVSNRTEKTLNDEDLAERGSKRVITLNCPILETGIINAGDEDVIYGGKIRTRSSTVNIVDGQVICNAYRHSDERFLDFIFKKGCMLMKLSESGKITYHKECLYKEP